MIIATILSIAGGGSLAYIVVRLLLDSIEISGLVTYSVAAAIAIIVFIASSAYRNEHKNEKKGTAPKKLNYVELKYLTFNIVSGVIFAALLVGYIALYFFITDLVYADRIMNYSAQYFDFIGLIVSGVAFAFVSGTINYIDFDNAIFGTYHPSKRKISETKNFIYNIYENKGLRRSVARVGRIFGYIYIAIIICAMFINKYAVSMLAVSPLFFLCLPSEFDDKTYGEFIAKKANCEEWQKYVCTYCETLIPGSAYVGKSNEHSSSTQYRDTTTTTTTSTDTTVIGNTTYYDTTVSTDVKVEDYVMTHSTHLANFKCPCCNRIHSVYHSSYTRTDL